MGGASRSRSFYSPYQVQCPVKYTPQCTNLRGPSIDTSHQVSVHMAKGFQRRRIKCEKLTDGRHQQLMSLPLTMCSVPARPKQRGTAPPPPKNFAPLCPFYPSLAPLCPFHAVHESQTFMCCPLVTLSRNLSN